MQLAAEDLHREAIAQARAQKNRRENVPACDR